MSKTAEEVIADYIPDAAIHDSLTADDADQIVSALDAAGFVIVPKEPTREMIDLGLKNFRVAAPMEVAAAYVAMIYAQPQPHKTPGHG